MQLFSPWRAEKLKDWRDTNICVKEFQERQEIISKVKSKIFPFSMQEIIEEMKSYESARNEGKNLHIIHF